VPLVDPAKALLEKYKDSGEVNPIPLVSQQKYNQYLKVIGRRAGLSEKVIQHHYKGREMTESILPKWKLLTSQVGRKTFLSHGCFPGYPPGDGQQDYRPETGETSRHTTIFSIPGSPWE
jgi:hypothetical protein